MAVSIFPPKRGDVPPFATAFALQQDNWNDYSFQTLYHLYHRAADSTQSLIGGVKILRRGQTEQDGIQITTHFERLSPEFCSVGTSLDYYQRLNEIAPDERDEILSALRDVVAQPALQREFETERGWRTSLFRDDPYPERFLADAAAIYSKNFGGLADLNAALIFRPAQWTVPLTLDFGAPLPAFYMGPQRRLGPSGQQVLLPRRVIVMIGRNGSGKSTLLARIARIAFASPSDRTTPELRAIGAFEPVSVGFPRVISISYSAFDNFVVPGLYESERRQIAADIERGAGRYVYVGLRDIVREVRDDLEAAARQPDAPDARRILQVQDRRATTHLKSLVQLADEFARLVRQISDNGDNALFDAALQPLLADPSFADIESQERIALLGDDPRTAFLGWSTGHKIALHVVASLVAHATRRALVLFDEPEMHLHPPLIAALMHAVRLVLEEKNAFALVATHSPVILQETLARHVRVIRRIGNTFSVLAPNLETFGENVGVLTYDTFGLTAATTDFHHILDLLIQGFNSLEEINQLFTPRLSGQALAYVMAGLARKGRQT
jgi:energy-coupling factor transporter ATP-binding protein EcfA2